MEDHEARFVSREEVFSQRPERAAGLRFAGLWVSGSLAGLAARTVAVVGTRAPSEAGRARARDLAEALAQAGICVISGLALGIDGAAHAGALAGDGRTIGILGGGHRNFFPMRNAPLARAMLAAGGAVISPFEPGEAARPWQFLQRNSVVAALSDAVVVVEAAARSGALNTASWAADLGIDVLAFPGDVERPKAAGCNALIRDGATLVRHAEDVLGAFGITPVPRARQTALRLEDPLEARLLEALSGETCDLEGLCERSRAAPGETLAALVRLQIAGVVERGDAGSWIAKRLPAPKARRGSPRDR